MKKHLIKNRGITSILFFFLLNLSINSSASAQPDKLIFAIDIVRHGDRTPIFKIPKAPASNAEVLGQLTGEGMQQEYQRGVELRHRYIETAHLLPPNYNTETIYVHSTDFDRTLMSTESLLLGLYPLGTGPKLASGQFALPSGFQPIPIHTIPSEQDNELIRKLDAKKLKDLKSSFVFTRPDWKQKTKELQPYFARWSQLTGIPITSLDQLKPIGETLYIYQQHHLALPEGITPDDAKILIATGKWVYGTTFKPQKMGDTFGRPFLAVITPYLQQVTENKTTLKFVLFTAHDDTILSVLSALHAPLDETPPYASDLTIALYEAGKDDYRVKMTLNGQPVQIPGCQNGNCTLTQFIELAKKASA